MRKSFVLIGVLFIICTACSSAANDGKTDGLLAADHITNHSAALKADDQARLSNTEGTGQTSHPQTGRPTGLATHSAELTDTAKSKNAVLGTDTTAAETVKHATAEAVNHTSAEAVNHAETETANQAATNVDHTTNKPADAGDKMAKTSAPEQVAEAKPQQVVKGFQAAKIRIPAIRLQTAIEKVGVLANGQMGVPKSFDKVGILAPWTNPGELGSAVIAGHFDHYTGPAVFYRLRDLKAGDEIIVSDPKGSSLTFQVTRVESFKTSEAPVEEIFSQSKGAHLNLITCSGKYNRKTGEHEKRLVVFSKLAKTM
ncbi:sortase [Brevibacillus ruminantium]|uniref:Sortase n=1 Tax=Brevibacillus ruminantium TaxID=2950604 RepID=A0ABY4WDN4_9BACL|nr:class F sortase [Brevibacillus ruminantium]USG65286.1 sortase [Brevibacillus ruminantium]